MSRSTADGSTDELARNGARVAMQASDGGRIPIVSVDTGGTFTDLVLLQPDSTDVRTLKVPSTPDDPGRAIVTGLNEMLPAGGEFILLHGSTVATNALLERKGGRVVLVANRGFEDVLEIGRQNRPQLYALSGHRPPPLVANEDRIGLDGRLAADGTELRPMDVSGLADQVDRLATADAIAVCLLHSYADPGHERTVAEAIGALLSGRDHTPPLSLSSAVLPEFREYERTSTTVVNAYVSRVMRGYLTALENALRGRALRVAVMGSAGGLLSVERATGQPVHTILSGPAGGVVGARAWAELAGRSHIVTFDMGGTSTDVSLCPGRALHTREFEIAGAPVAVPVLDIHTVGAGGGSVAWIDPGGALRVGPESAGAEPGPVCYARGGDRVTVTDAHVWLGRLPSEAFLGGGTPLDREAVEAPLRSLAERMGTTPEAAAEGIIEVANATMERALRVMSVERGHDPADLGLVAFGGAGGLHAAELAGRLGCAEALVPPSPGLLSAFGILVAPPRREASRTLLRTIDPADSMLESTRRELEATARRGLSAEGVDEDEISVTSYIDARYLGQSFELRTDAEGDPSRWLDTFHAEHERRYGYARPERAVECVTLRAVATAPARRLPARAVGPDPSGSVAGTPQTSLSRTVRVWMGDEEIDVPMADRSQLDSGSRLDGPAVIADYSSTTWIPPRWRAEVDPSGVLRLRLGADDDML